MLKAFKMLEENHKQREKKMSREFWGIIGAIVALGLLMAALIVPQLNSINSRLIRVETELSTLSQEVARIQGRMGIPDDTVAVVE